MSIREKVKQEKIVLNTLSVEERSALRDSVHRLLNAKSTEADVRATMETTAALMLNSGGS